VAGELTLDDVVAKIRKIGGDHYNLQVYDNIVEIFDRLTEDEQRVFLRSVITLVGIQQGTTTSTGTVGDLSSIITELGHLRIEDMRRSSEFKTILAKGLSLVVGLGLTASIVLILLGAYTSNGVTTFLNDLGQKIAIIFFP